MTKLSRPLTMIADGHPFRSRMEMIGKRSGINVWVCRDVDPTRPIDSGALGPTVIEAIEKLAADHQCQVFPVANVLLVGPQPWCERVATSIWKFKYKNPPSAASNARRSPQTIAWPKLTTPTEAYQIAAGRSAGSGADVSLPHDLWPAAELSRVDRHVVRCLIAGQFAAWKADRNPAVSDLYRRLHPILFASTLDETIDHLYVGIDSQAIGRVIAQAETTAKLKVDGKSVWVRTDAAGHRAIIRELIDRRAKAESPKTTEQEKIFEPLRIKNARVSDVLRQLAAAGSRQCLILTEADQACSQLITLDTKDRATLREIIKAVADQAGVIATWTSSEITISLPK